MIYPIILYGNSVLREICKDIVPSKVDVALGDDFGQAS